MEKLLDKLSTLLKTDVRYLIVGGGALVIGQGLNSFIALAATVAFANLLPKDAYGTFQYILSAAEFILVFSLIGLPQSAVRSVAKGYDGTLEESFKKNLLWGIGSVCIGFLVGGYYIINGNIVLGYGITAAASFLLLINSSKLYQSFLIGKKLFIPSSIAITIGYLVPAIAMVSALFLTDNIIILISVYLLSHAAVNGSLFLWSRRYKENSDIDKETIPQAKHFSLQNFIPRAASYIDRILLFQFVGPIALAEYWLAASVQRTFSHFFKSAKAVVLPKVSVRSYGKLKKSLPRKILLLYVFIVPLTVLYVLATPYIFSLLFPEYVSSAIYAQALGLLFLFLPMTILRDVFIGHAKHAILYKIKITISVIKIVTTIILVPIFGIWGVVFSVLANQMLNTILILFFFFTEKAET